MSNPVNDQDWETVVFRKRLNKTDALKQAQRTGGLETVRKFETGNKQSAPNVNASRLERMDTSDEKLTLKMIDTKAVEAIKKRRAELKLTQKDLANKAQVPEPTLKSLEQGKEQHNPALLSKLQRVLGVKLLGQNIGEPL